jgi:activator of HSP90 ATPase
MEKESPMSKPIRQIVIFNASPHIIYEALMDSATHAAFTGSAASISREVGGEIRAYDGYISGRNVELVPDQKIVQSWRAVDWPEDYFSLITFQLIPVPEGTQLQFEHVGIPAGEEIAFEEGWIDNYWEPLKEYLRQ